MKVVKIDNYLNITLTKSNPCLHPARLFSLYKEFKGEKIKRNPLFYKEWDDIASDALLKLDDEVSNIINELREFDLSEVESLRVHYEGNTPEEITKTITNIDSLKAIKSPIKIKEGTYYFDYNSRYFKADIPFGLLIYKGIAELLNVKTLMIDKICDAFKGNIDLSYNGMPQSFGINTREEFVNLYMSLSVN